METACAVLQDRAKVLRFKRGEPHSQRHQATDIEIPSLKRPSSCASSVGVSSVEHGYTTTKYRDVYEVYLYSAWHFIASRRKFPLLVLSQGVYFKLRGEKEDVFLNLFAMRLENYLFIYSCNKKIHLG